MPAPLIGGWGTKSPENGVWMQPRQKLNSFLHYCQLWLQFCTYHIISYIIRTNVLEHTRHTSALTVAQKHNETFQRNSTELKS